MPLPTLRLPMASTSSLVFFGLTESCCWTGFSCAFCCCSEGGATLAGSDVGGGLCAKTVLAASAPKIVNRVACRRIACIAFHLRLTVVYTSNTSGLHKPSLSLRCQVEQRGFLHLQDSVRFDEKFRRQ